MPVTKSNRKGTEVMSRRKKSLLAISVTLLVTLMGAGAAVGAADGSGGEEVRGRLVLRWEDFTLPYGERPFELTAYPEGAYVGVPPADLPRDATMVITAVEHPPVVPATMMLRWEDFTLPYGERPFELTAYPEGAYVGVPPADLPRDATMVITVVGRPQESPQVPRPMQVFRWEEEFAIEVPVDAKRPFELLTYPGDADVKWIDMRIPGNPDTPSEQAVEPVAVVPISGTLTPGTGHAHGPWFFSTGDTMSISTTWVPGDSAVSVGIWCVATGRGQLITTRFGYAHASWTILTAGWYQSLVINHGPQTIVYSGFTDI